MMSDLQQVIKQSLKAQRVIFTEIYWLLSNGTENIYAFFGQTKFY